MYLLKLFHEFMIKPAKAVSTFHEIREVYIDRVICSMSIIGIPLAFFAMFRSISMSLWIMASVQLFVISVGIFITYNLKHIPLKYKFTFTYTAFYLIGLAALYTYGIATSGWAFLIGGAVISSTIIGWQRAARLGIVVSACIVLIAASHIYYPHVAAATLVSLYSPIAWTVVIISFFTICISMTLAAGTMHQVTKQLLRKLELKNKEILLLANSDVLTGLANRRAAYERIQYLINTQQRNPATEFHLILIDLDGFKSINDTYGHEAGDEVLKTVSKRLEAIVRPTDMVARLGGDEFLIIISSGLGKDIKAVSNRILSQIKLAMVYKNSILSVGASVGVTGCQAKHTITPDALVRAADTAMFKVKHCGKNAVAYQDSGFII